MEEMLIVLKRLRPTIERIGGGGHEGEDLFSDVALACVERAAQYDWSHPAIDGRVMRMARNLKVTRLRRERKRRCDALPSDDCPALAVRDDMTASETGVTESRRCQQAVESLSQPSRRVIQQRFTEGKRLAEIAAELRVPAATIRTRCRRALQQLALDPEIQRLQQER